MNIEYKRFKEIATGFGVTTLSKSDAEAIVGIARLAVDADRHVDPDELRLYDILSNHVCALAGVDAKAFEDAEAIKPRGDDDRETRMLVRAKQLSAKGPRELAYSCAYMVAIADLDIKPVEDKFLNKLLEALGIDETREREIAGDINDALVPD